MDTVRLSAHEPDFESRKLYLDLGQDTALAQESYSETTGNDQESIDWPHAAAPPGSPGAEEAAPGSAAPESRRGSAWAFAPRFWSRDTAQTAVKHHSHTLQTICAHPDAPSKTKPKYLDSMNTCRPRLFSAWKWIGALSERERFGS